MSRLIDSGPDLVRFFPEVEVTDSYGTPHRAPAAAALVISTHVQRSTAEEADALGQQAESLWRFTTSRDLPSGAWAGLTVNGRPAEVVGEPQRQGRSERTAHTLVRLRFVDAPEVAR